MADSPKPGPVPPPRGRWRLGGFVALSSVAQQISHILIRHEEVESSRVSLNMLEWYTTYAPSRRSRIEAWQLAEQIALRARQNPAAFADLAREVSEDPTTQLVGGELGLVVASQLFAWPAVLDALAATPEGGVSGVVETAEGFHVFSRRAPDAARTLSGARIVLAHTDAPFIAQVAVARRPVTRSREEALTLAQEVYERARSAPASFASLALEHSDHEEAERGGDFGTYSSREPTALTRELATLARLQVGEVAPPLETFFGFAIIQRTKDQPRQRFAAGTIQFPFDPENPVTKLSALEEARSTAALLARDPQLFEELQQSRCCSGALEVVEGRDTPELESRLGELRPGELAPEPVLSSTRYLLIKRLPSDVLPPLRAVSTELPSAEYVDLFELAHNLQPSFLELELRHVAERAETELQIDPPTARELRLRHEHGAKFNGLGPEQRVTVLRRLDAEIEKLLGPELHGRYRALAQRHLADAAMRAN